MAKAKPISARKPRNRKTPVSWRDENGDLAFGFAGESWASDFENKKITASYTDVPNRLKPLFGLNAQASLYPMINSLPLPFNYNGQYIDISDIMPRKVLLSNRDYNWWHQKPLTEKQYQPLY